MKYICEECRNETMWVEYDHGYGGSYRGDHYLDHKDYVPVSVCCGDSVLFIEEDGYRDYVNKLNKNDHRQAEYDGI